MGQELTQVLCPECGTAGESDPGMSSWQCTKCGNGFFLRRCSACARVSYVNGLRSPSLMAVVTRGHLSAAFTAVPRKVSITLTSAQAMLRLPARAAYRIGQQVTSGHVRVGIPQAASATRTVTARIDSGDLELLPS